VFSEFPVQYEVPSRRSAARKESAMALKEFHVSCHNCGGQFDAAQASWCTCIVKQRSFACPYCLKCFCKAPAAYRQKFWADAPDHLWQRKAEEKRESVPPLNLPVDSVKRPLVLVVDDEREIQAVVSRAVESLGFGLIVARDGEEGLDLALYFKPDLILTDALMPKLDGREMTLRVKSDPRLASTKVVIMTSIYKGLNYRSEGTGKYRADHYLEKPIEFADLRALLQKHLG
jgi:CheY-like chemotaxis protein